MDTLSTELIQLCLQFCDSSRDIAQVCRLNKKFYSIGIQILFKTVEIKGPAQYMTFCRHMDSMREKGLFKLVRHLDFMGYTTHGVRFSQEEARKAVTPEGFAQLLDECVDLRELSVTNELNHVFQDSSVIRSIFTSHQRIESIDLIGFFHLKYANTMSSLFAQNVTTCDKDLHEKHEAHCNKPSDYIPTLPTQLPPLTISSYLSRVSFYLNATLTQSEFFTPFFKLLKENDIALTHIDVGHTRVTGDIFNHILPQKLTHFGLQGCRLVALDNNASQFFTRCTNLQELNLNMRAGIVLPRNPRDAPPCYWFSSQSLKQLLVSCNKKKDLRVLHLGGQGELDDEILESCMPTTHRLTHLSIAGASKVTAERFMDTLTQMPHLEYLDLSNTFFDTTVDGLQATLAVIRETRCLDNLKVIEFCSSKAMRFPESWLGWKFMTHNLRSYYFRQDVNPCYSMPQKLPAVGRVPRSAMEKYWRFSL
ncbi:hypothetical protein CLU79DRAFT_751663 [Phycomyces nitens]|nr:hypothetical protein CLU79DRAFT_751663 [Phycomyces nitens]